jgi:hypothetical protein
MAFRNHPDEVTKEARISGQWLVVSGQNGSLGKKFACAVELVCWPLITDHWPLTTNHYFLLGWASRWPEKTL